MSILIKDMKKMPNSFIDVRIYSDGRVISKSLSKFGEQIATAIYVPPHGDLIDRQTTYNSLLDGMVMTGYQSMALDCIRECYVPTVIPAEEKE